MNANFYLKDSTKKSTLVRLHLAFDGKMLKYGTGINIKPTQWSKVKQKIHSGVPNSESMNIYLDNLKTTAKDEYYKLITEKKVPTGEYFKTFLDDKFKQGKKDAVFIIDHFKEFIKSNINRKQKTTIKGYTALLNHLIEFEKKSKKQLTFESLTSKFYHKLVDYFAYEKIILNRTIKENYIKNFNVFLNWCVRNENLAKNPFKGIKFPYKINPAQTIALYEEELNRIYNLDLSEHKRLQWVRDVLCFECYSGLRFSDLDNVTPNKINGNTLDVVVKKTNDLLKVPLRPEALEIINKYFKNNLPFPEKSNQKTNKYIKELGKLAELNENVTSIYLSGINSKQETKPKYEMLETHTGRRTFVTLSYQKGMRVLDIMAITGHKDYDSFIKYYRLDKIKVHENFHAAWSNIKPKYEISQIIKNLLAKKVDIEVISSSFGIDVKEIDLLS